MNGEVNGPVALPKNFEVKLNQAIASWYDSDDQLLAELAGRVGMSHGVGSEFLDDEYQIAGSLFGLVAKAQNSYCQRLANQKETNTVDVYRHDRRDLRWAVQWIGWCAILDYEIESGLTVAEDSAASFADEESQSAPERQPVEDKDESDGTTGELESDDEETESSSDWTLHQSGKQQVLGPFYGGVGRGLLSLREDLDVYLGKLKVSEYQVVDQIIRTAMGLVDESDEGFFEPSSVDEALGKVLGKTVQSLRGSRDDPQTVAGGQRGIAVRDPQDHRSQLKEKDSDGKERVRRYGMLWLDDEDTFKEVEADEPRTGGVDVEGQAIASAYLSAQSVVIAWSGDARSYRDANRKGGAVTHKLFGFTGREKLGLKLCVPLEDEDPFDSMSTLGATIRRGYNNALDEIQRILYMIGGIGPEGAFPGTKNMAKAINALDAAVSETDSAYKGRIKGNPIIKILRGASGITAASAEGEVTHVVSPEAVVFLQEVTGTSQFTSFHDSFVAGLDKLSIAASSEPVASLHWCEDYWATSFGRKDPECVYGSRCQKHQTSERN